jgi:predicted CopG family antitoxin
MKNINVVFEDKEYKTLIRRKGKKSWHDFIMELAYEGDR